ncbi:MAG: WYL domain-containing protein [Oscillospiraceae bacterium]|nr:WYL domain-containing protein [Oscillospiraceae bacterium]
MSDKKRSFLNDYEKFRALLRPVFFLGSYTIDEFLKLEELGIKKTQYQNYKIIAEDIIEKLSSHKENNKSALKYDVEQFEKNYNYLSESYFIKSLTPLEAGITISILLMLNISDGYEESELIELLYGQEEKTVKSKIRSMEDNGLITRCGSKYRIIDNPLLDLSNRDFQMLLYFVDFQKSRIYPNCFGAFLYSSMCRIYEKRFSCEYESPFVLKCNYLGNILDDEIQWELLRAIYAHKTVSFRYRLNRNNTVKDIIPCRLLTEDQLNRVYLMGIRRTSRGDKKRFYRLDKISYLEITGEQPDNYTDEYVKSFYIESMQDSFSNIPVSSQKQTLLKLKYVSSMENEIRRQFSSVTFDKQHHIAEVLVKTDDNVLNPWLRYHAGTIEILNDCSIKAELDQEMQEMKKLYGIIS